MGLTKPVVEQGMLAAWPSLAGRRGPALRLLMGAWLEKYSMDCDGRSQVPARVGVGEVNVLPETLGQEHTKIHISVLPVVCWVPVVFGVGARRGAARGVLEAVGNAQPHLCGWTCWAGADV